MITKGDDRSGAIFSDCGRYRYRLWRMWNPNLPRMCCVMLNPSTADEIDNDATIERRVRHVRKLMDRERMHFGAVEVVNLFALRSTDPAMLRKVDDPVGPENDRSILAAAYAAADSLGRVLCGWGGDGLIGGRHAAVLKLLADRSLCALKINKDGTPQHPLYLSYSLVPRYWMPEVNDLGDEAV